MAVHGDDDDDEIAAIHNGFEVLGVSTADSPVMKFGHVAGVRSLLRQAPDVPIQTADHRDSHGVLVRGRAGNGTAQHDVMTTSIVAPARPSRWTLVYYAGHMAYPLSWAMMSMHARHHVNTPTHSALCAAL